MHAICVWGKIRLENDISVVEACISLQDQRPTNATYGYDFRETSAASHAIVVQKVRKADFEDKNYSGMLCHVIQYASTEIMYTAVV